MSRIYSLFKTKKIVTLAHFDRTKTVMEAISDKDVAALNANSKTREVFFTTRNGNTVSSKDIYLYGEVDLNSKDDIKFIKKFTNAIVNTIDYHCWLYTSFDYKSGTITKDPLKNCFIGINAISNPIEWFKYNYCLIGKPKNIILYSMPYAKGIH